MYLKQHSFIYFSLVHQVFICLSKTFTFFTKDSPDHHMLSLVPTSICLSHYVLLCLTMHLLIPTHSKHMSSCIHLSHPEVICEPSMSQHSLVSPIIDLSHPACPSTHLSHPAFTCLTHHWLVSPITDLSHPACPSTHLHHQPLLTKQLLVYYQAVTCPTKQYLLVSPTIQLLWFISPSIIPLTNQAYTMKTKGGTFSQLLKL